MEQLLKQDPIAMGMLGKQPIRMQKYRPLTYVLTGEDAGKKAYYNLLTHEVIAANLNELDTPELRRYLIENWYLVPEEHDDQQLVDECRAVLTLMDSWPKKIHAFHIFTTLDCNARCFYCFEKRMPGSEMTKETAARAVEYMQEQADGELIKIVWFGGEPLFNYPVIDFITNGLKEKGLQFESDMISNGLLFDDELVEKAKSIWNVKSVQITLELHCLEGSLCDDLLQILRKALPEFLGYYDCISCIKVMCECVVRLYFIELVGVSKNDAVVLAVYCSVLKCSVKFGECHGCGVGSHRLVCGDVNG